MKADLKIPEDRIGALVGEKRRELNRLERETHVKIRVKDNDVFIEGEAENVWKARDVVRAVGRGFSPVRAVRLAKDSSLEIIDLSNLSDSRMKAVRARIIGRGGRTRELIEEFTGVYISVYGKTVSVIGDTGVAAALEAIEMLIKGVRHGVVYEYLEDWIKTRKAIGD
ncbi:MAG: hypothetical protein HYS81_05420 [Candidatus Aenigmatarchaeota archaeon]|nr:MAG: hypothetical protein HYS81_05420 [Candidatus Aenigmarchaeota archaeon]